MEGLELGMLRRSGSDRREEATLDHIANFKMLSREDFPGIACS